MSDFTVWDSPAPGEWARAGRCRTTPPSLWFPTRGDDTSQAKAICAGCPVLAECRAYALATPGLLGIWGGTTGQDRRRARGESAA